MPAFEAAGAGNAIATRAARGDHPLVFGQDDRGDGLLSLSPSVFTGGGAVPVRADLGQFASLLLDSVARLSRAGAPTKTLATHRCSDVALDRLWSTALQILDGKPPPEKFFFSSRGNAGSSSVGCATYVLAPPLPNSPASRSPTRTSSRFRAMSTTLTRKPYSATGRSARTPLVGLAPLAGSPFIGHESLGRHSYGVALYRAYHPHGHGTWALASTLPIRWLHTSMWALASTLPIWWLYTSMWALASTLPIWWLYTSMGALASTLPIWWLY